MLIFYMAGAWLAGVGVQYYLAPAGQFGYIALGLGVAFALLWPHRIRQLNIGLVVAIMFCVGVWGLTNAQHDRDQLNELQQRGTVLLEGVVVAEPDERDTRTLLRVQAERVRWLGVWREWQGVVQISVSADQDVAYGDRVIASGTLLPPPVIDEFDYGQYLAQRGVHSLMSPIRFEVIAHDQGVWWRDGLISIKRTAQDHIESALPEPEASLLVGILLGDDKGLDADVKSAFNDTATSHIIAISGFNMTLIAVLVQAFLQLFIQSARRVAILSIITIAIYTIFVGASAPVVRATIMSSVLLVAPLIQRPTYVPASLTFTALIMAMIQPLVLWDVGFQLSFAAVLGLAVLEPPLRRWFSQNLIQVVGQRIGQPLLEFLTEPVVAGLAAQAFTLPIVLYHFERLSMVAVVANLLIVPVQSYVLMLGGMAVLISLVWPFWGQLFFAAAWLPLAWTTYWVRELGQLPFAATNFTLSAEVLTLLASVAGATTLLQARRPTWYVRWGQSLKVLARLIVIVGTIMLIALLLQRTLHRPDGDLHVVFVDAGQSNTTLIETPNGAVFLIDGGRYPSRLLTILGDELPSTKRDIDILWLSGDQASNIGALPMLLERYSVKTVITAVQESREQTYVDLLDQLAAQGATILPTDEGRVIQTADGVTIRTIAPNRYADTIDALVLRMEYGETVFLLTSTLSAEDEGILLQQQHLIQAHVLQVASHAEDNSNSEAWLAAVGAQVLVLQYDPSQFDADASPQVIRRLAEYNLFRTDLNGTVAVISDGQQLRVVTQR